MTALEPDLSVSTSYPPSVRDGDIAAAISYLVPSAQPAVVFSSLAKLCVPLFSDGCMVDIVEGDCASYRIAYPSLEAQSSRHRGSAGTPVRTRFEGPSVMGAPEYAGVLTHTWHTHEPTADDVNRAALLARHAVTTIYFERLTSHAYDDDECVDQVRSGREDAT